MTRTWLLLAYLGIINATTNPSNHSKTSGECKPLVIAHRGASGYIPEHTLGAYALAITMGADYIEPDLVMTKDGHLVALHDNELGRTTNVRDKRKFDNRYFTKKVDGNEITGWFTENFTLAEIKTLRCKERLPNIRPGNARLDGAYLIPTLQEIIDLVKAMEQSEKRIIGIYPEIKHSTHFQLLGLPMEKLLVDTLNNNGYHGNEAPIYIQSFEVENLKKLRNITNIRLLQLYLNDKTKKPYDQYLLNTNLTYGIMATPEGLKEVANYANAVGPDKSYIIPLTENNRLGQPTSFVADAHSAGLMVHPYIFRSENTFLPIEYRSNDDSPTSIGNAKGEIAAFLATGIDGLFTEQPDVVVGLRGKC